MKNNTKPTLIAAGAIGILLVIVFSVSIGNKSGRFASKTFFAEMKEGELDSVLVKISDQINKGLPIMVNLETRLDSTVGADKQFRYNYTMVNYASGELDVNHFIHTTQPKLITAACTNKDMKEFMDNGVPIIYAYYSSDGKHFTDITVQPSQCEYISKS